MYYRTAIPSMAALVHAGLLDLRPFDVTAFPLDAANEAVTHAAANPQDFKLTALRK